MAFDKGFYVKPTVFANVRNDMNIAREEIFGPVISILGYQGVEDAVEIGNDTDYGLAAYISGGDIGKVREVATRLRAGQVQLNGVGDMSAPFGGYKMSGNGREWGEFGFHDYLETKAVTGYTPRQAAGNRALPGDHLAVRAGVCVVRDDALAPSAQTSTMTRFVLADATRSRHPARSPLDAELVTLEGYAPRDGTRATPDRSRRAAGMVGNALLGGVIGVGIDATSGAADDLYAQSPSA